MSACLVCGGHDGPGERPWCSKTCRATMRRYGASLAPGRPRAEQLDAALAQRATMAALGLPMSPTFARTTRVRSP